MNRLNSAKGGVDLQSPPSPNRTNGPRFNPASLSGASAESGASTGYSGAGAGRESTAAVGERETAGGEQSPSGRDANGRFVKGNRGGPGNPFGRQMAALRKRLQAKVTDEVIDRIADQLIKQAEEGDVPSAKLLFSYAIGKPTEAVDPDTLDVQEWNVMRQTSVAVEDWHKLMQYPPVRTVCEVMRHTLPCLEAQFAAQVRDKLAPAGPPESNGIEEDYSEEEAERPRAAKRSRSRKSRRRHTKGSAPAPSRNVANGVKGHAQSGAPSRKGTNGSGGGGESPSGAGDSPPCSTPATQA